MSEEVQSTDPAEEVQSTDSAEEAQSTDSMIAALLREREGLVQRGLDDRVAQVDEQLALRGHTPPAGKRSAPAGRSAPPRGRRARSTETT